ncbi:MAG: DNA primase [Planctomycetes bacterium]|nr:DNA primase [Planctomycetota bacterium]
MSSDSHEFKRFVEEVKSRLPVESLVREWGKEPVHRSNRLWACCPLHEEDTPSFTIGPDPGLWYCFGACSTGGDVLDLIQKRLGISFMEALEDAATRVGLEVPRRKGQGPGTGDSSDEPALKLLRRAEDFYRKCLAGPEGRAAREYLQSRGFDQDTIDSFGLGFAPQGAPIARRLEAQGADAVRLGEAVGLLRRREDGSAYDFFWNRLMVPIRDARGRTVGFGARLLPGADGPKYVNTPETTWFKKGSLIYGFDKALQHARTQKRLILVEGYTDVMALHAAGLRESVAVLGTSTTSQHARLVRKTGAQTGILLFDGDEAGRKAAVKALLGLLPLELELKVVRIDGGEDPADVIARDGAAGMEAHLENAMGWSEFLLGGLRKLRGRERVSGLAELFKLVSVLKHATMADEVLRQASSELDIRYEALRADYDRFARDQRGSGAMGGARRTGGGDSGGGDFDGGSDGGGSDEEGTTSGPPGVERSKRDRAAMTNILADLLGAVLVDFEVFPGVRAALDRHLPASGRAIFEAMCSLWDEDKDPTPSAVLNQLGDDPARKKVMGLVSRAMTAESPRSLVDQALKALDKILRKECLKHLKLEIQELERRAAAGDETAEAGLVDALRLMAQVQAGGELPELCSATPSSGPPPSDEGPDHQAPGQEPAA